VTHAGAKNVTVDPSGHDIPIADAAGVRLRAVLPRAWPPKCNADPNACSIMLRVDYCASSILFTGDAESVEEGLVDAFGPVTLLQVGHHGSSTSSSEAFVTRVAPKYAVISAAKPHEGLNKDYCHPRASTVRRLTTHLGGPASRSMRAYDSDGCDDRSDTRWVDLPASDRLWATERDGDVVLSTTGDGTFVRD
jgi:competence protein ComEC